MPLGLPPEKGQGATSANSGDLELYLTTVNLDFSLPVPEKNMSLAWGAGYRRDNYQIEAGEEYSYRDYDDPPDAGGPSGIQVFPGFKPDNEVNESRNALSLYTDAEMFVNDLGVFDKVMFSPAVRYEHYSDFGHTVNGKLATKLDFSRAFAVRGSMSSGFRAPSMHQLYFNSVSNQFYWTVMALLRAKAPSGTTAPSQKPSASRNSSKRPQPT